MSAPQWRTADWVVDLSTICSVDNVSLYEVTINYDIVRCAAPRSRTARRAPIDHLMTDNTSILHTTPYVGRARKSSHNSLYNVQWTPVRLVWRSPYLSWRTLLQVQTIDLSRPISSPQDKHCREPPAANPQRKLFSCSVVCNALYPSAEGR